MQKTFTASGQRSAVFIGGRFGFDVGITITAGTNSLTIEKEIDGVWYVQGAAITTTGTVRRFNPAEHYTPGQRFRVVCGTFDTGPVRADINGDIIGPGASMTAVGGSRLLESGVARTLEDGSFRILEDA